MPTTKIPLELAARAISNLEPLLRGMPEGQRMNEMVNAEFRRLMRKEHPCVKVTDKDITRAVVELQRSQQQQHPTAQIRPKTLSQDEVKELERLVGQMSGFVKMMMGVADNVALTVMKSALDKIQDVRSKSSYEERPRQPHPGYRHGAKRMLNDAVREAERWRTRLLWPAQGELRFFHVDDMPPEARKKYGAMTDTEYFDFWQATGGTAYARCLPLVGSLHNKFRKSMQEHGVRAAAQTAWGLTALTILQLAVETWERSMRSVNEAMEGRLQPAFMERIYKPFSLAKVADLWQQGLVALSPETATYKLTASEERNIELGVQQLREAWIDPAMPFESLMGAVEDYDEDVFRTRGEAKKALREIAEMRDQAVEDVRKIRQEAAKERLSNTTTLTT